MYLAPTSFIGSIRPRTARAIAAAWGISLCVAAGVGTSSGCSGGGSHVVRVDPNAPVLPPPSLPPEAVTTDIQVPVRIDLAALTAEVNRAVPPRFQDHREKEFTNLLKADWVEYDVTRGDIALAWDGDRLRATIPVQGRLTLGGQFYPLPIGGGIGVRETASFEGSVHAETPLTPRADYSLDLQPTANLRLDDAEVRLVSNRIRVSVRGRMQEEFARAAPAVIASAVESIRPRLTFRPQAEQAWPKLFAATRVHDRPAAWLVSEPQDVRVMPLRGDGGAVLTGVAMRARLVAVLADEAAPPAVRPLPDLVVDSGIAPAFHVILPVHLDLPYGVAELRREVVGRAYAGDDAGAEITVRSLDVQTSGDWLVVSLGFDGRQATTGLRASGTLYAVGRTAYDPDTRVLSVADLDYDVETRNVLLRIADWLLKPRVLASVAAAARADLSGPLEAARVRANEQLASLEVGPDARLDARVSDLDLHDVRVYGNGVFALFSARGESELRWGE